MNPVILIACFSPLAAIWIVMKVADVDEEEEEYGDRTDYR